MTFASGPPRSVAMHWGEHGDTEARMSERKMDRRSGEDTERVPWWSRPVTIAIRLIAIAVFAVFIVLTVVRLLNP